MFAALPIKLTRVDAKTILVNPSQIKYATPKITAAGDCVEIIFGEGTSPLLVLETLEQIYELQMGHLKAFAAIVVEGLEALDMNLTRAEAGEYMTELEKS